jgi:hypothetical protein
MSRVGKVEARAPPSVRQRPFLPHGRYAIIVGPSALRLGGPVCVHRRTRVPAVHVLAPRQAS